jgi:hypothetical protein
LKEDCDALWLFCKRKHGFSSVLNTQFCRFEMYTTNLYKSTMVCIAPAWYSEDFNTVQIWGTNSIAKKVSFCFGHPYHFHNRETPTEIKVFLDLRCYCFRMYQFIEQKKIHKCYQYHSMVELKCQLKT